MTIVGKYDILKKYKKYIFAVHVSTMVNEYTKQIVNMYKYGMQGGGGGFNLSYYEMKNESHEVANYLENALVAYKSDWTGFHLPILMSLYYFFYIDGTCHYNQ